MANDDERLENITGKQAGEDAKAREAAYFADRRKCRCKVPHVTRKYLGAGLCLNCGQPRYEA